MTAGFVIGGTTAKTVLIRATGPALAGLGVQGTMPDPQLALHTTIGNQDVVLAANAGWGGDPQLTAVSNSVFAFPLTNPSQQGLGLADDAGARGVPRGRLQRQRHAGRRSDRSLRSPLGRSSGQFILKLALTRKTALTMAKAMNPTKINTHIRTALATTLVNVLSRLEMIFW